MSQEDVINRYFDMETIWDSADKWHFYTHNKIKEFINAMASDFLLDKKIAILNAGSGGEEYGLTEHSHIHVDIVDKKIKDQQYFIVTDIETVELVEKVDMVLCVGSVLNYADPVRAIKNFSKLLNPGGYLLIEYEKSSSLEFLLHPSFNQQVAIVKTFYGQYEEKLTVFSEKYIESILWHNKFISLKKENFHILSPLVFRLTKHSGVAAKFCKVDRLLKYIKPLSYFSSNIICLYQKA